MPDKNELKYEIKINGQIIENVINYKTFVSRFNPVSKMEIGINNTDRTFVDVLKIGDEVSFTAGYLDQITHDIFKGKISAIDGLDIVRLTAKNSIYFKDDDESLAYKGSFNNVTPHQLINHIFLKAGIPSSDIVLSPENFIEMNHFWFKNDSFIDAIKKVDKAWKLNTCLFMLGDKFYWNSRPTKKPENLEPVFEYGENLYNVEYQSGQGFAEVYPPVVDTQIFDNFTIDKNDVPRAKFIVDEILHVDNGAASGLTGMDAVPHSVIYFSIDPGLLSKRKRHFIRRRNPKKTEASIMSVVSRETESLKNKEDTIQGTIINVTGSGPYTVSVLPTDKDEHGEILPIIREIDFDNQKIFKVPTVGDKIKIGFVGGDSTRPYVADFGNIFDSGNKFYIDSNDIFHFVSEGNDIILKKQAAVAAPVGGATVDAEARTAINGLRDILTNLNLM